MNKFKDTILNEQNEAEARTDNGMKARKTSANKVLDYFGLAGSSRGTPLTVQFTRALIENEDLAIRALLWTRDVRGGAGERKQFRDMLQVLESRNVALAGRLIRKIPEVGRWDDLFSYKDSQNRKDAFAFIGEALSKGDGLCAKWMPRKGANAVELRKFLEMTPKQYRKTLVHLTNVVESQMCAKDWENINFSHVPSLASARYQKAFGRNASEAYSAYIRELQKPEEERDPSVKVNAGAVYPYDVLKSVLNGNKSVANAQWKALPNYVGDAKILPMIDVSGSMGSMNNYYSNTLSPIHYAVSLGLYLSEKNTSDFKDTYLTFSGNPDLNVVRGTLSERIDSIERAHWGFNTNLHAAFDKILTTAVKGDVPTRDMPEVLLILSDMQFDRCAQWNNSAQEMIKRKYEEFGYEMPKIVFWNLATHVRDNTPVRFDDLGVAHVSGFSPAIMKSVLSNDLEEFTPMNVMLDALLDERYNY